MALLNRPHISSSEKKRDLNVNQLYDSLSFWTKSIRHFIWRLLRAYITLTGPPVPNFAMATFKCETQENDWRESKVGHAMGVASSNWGIISNNSCE